MSWAVDAQACWLFGVCLTPDEKMRTTGCYHAQPGRQPRGHGRGRVSQAARPQSPRDLGAGPWPTQQEAQQDVLSGCWELNASLCPLGMRKLKFRALWRTPNEQEEAKHRGTQVQGQGGNKGSNHTSS